jgi:hypothetical protein
MSSWRNAYAQDTPSWHSRYFGRVDQSIRCSTSKFLRIFVPQIDMAVKQKRFRVLRLLKLVRVAGILV